MKWAHSFLCKSIEILRFWKLRVSTWLWVSYAVHNFYIPHITKECCVLPFMLIFCVFTYFSIVYNENLWQTKYIKHKKKWNLLYSKLHHIFIMFNYVDNDDGLVCFSNTAIDPYRFQWSVVQGTQIYYKSNTNFNTNLIHWNLIQIYMNVFTD